MKLFTSLFVVFFIALSSLFSRDAPGPIPGVIILQLDTKSSPQDLVSNSKSLPGQALELAYSRTLSAPNNIHLFSCDPELDLFEVIGRLTVLESVKAVQADYELSPRNTPDDPYFTDQWTLNRIGIAKAWDITTGGVTARGDTIVVAITDAGFNPRHGDILPNLWFNKGEIPDDGIDNDANGYIDDDRGWNFNLNNNVHPADNHGHRVAGIIGARGNNGFGTSGINWEVKMMLLTSTRISGLIEAYDYMIEQRRRYNESDGAEGAFVVATNLSLGLARTFCVDQPVWGSMYDRLGEVGILAGVAAANENFDVEEFGDMPPTCTSDYILAVTNTTRRDEKYEASAYGNTSVDLGAPGEGTVTIDLYDERSLFGGNSAAAPHVTGSIALLYSLPCEYLAEDALRQPAETALAIREALLNGVDPLNSLQDKTVTGGRLNLFQSLQLLSQGCSASIGDLDLITLYPNPTQGEVTIEMQTPDFETYELIVTNALGQVVYRENFSPLQLDPKRKSIKLTQLGAGMYVVSVSNGREISSKKLLVH
ncbi:S8/S53 family peptidase [Flavilitoribacter nigricans]|uniref:T9SS type A sorting domain-containing protein n=1 Tax=Flavilitoribacter nigricans (strain ATCC 23147 / DSM 23189 / NBRC 102662 / NCIMB 1420 / SS-2) TaxID=1122177 RepID=A0A2D0N6B7_FLAN2|nr:S8/S53 family peptidase [Flavilitoribacter nigricans]PHN03323.1 hypothetical protein CRP01_26940 [Flavilitoribacter nigricans DSM 23189 = NBRC 102662]